MPGGLGPGGPPFLHASHTPRRRCRVRWPRRGLGVGRTSGEPPHDVVYVPRARRAHAHARLHLPRVLRDWRKRLCAGITMERQPCLFISSCTISLLDLQGAFFSLLHHNNRSSAPNHHHHHHHHHTKLYRSIPLGNSLKPHLATSTSNLSSYLLSTPVQAALADEAPLIAWLNAHQGHAHINDSQLQKLQPLNH